MATTPSPSDVRNNRGHLHLGQALALGGGKPVFALGISDEWRCCANGIADRGNLLLKH